MYSVNYIDYEQGDKSKILRENVSIYFFYIMRIY